MQIIDTSSIKNWPSHVSLGYAEIKSEADSSWLNEIEKDEFDKMDNIQRKAEYATTRRLLKFMCRALTNLEAEPILFKDEEGKPHFDNMGDDWKLSYAHTKSGVFMALSKKREIGLDAEPENRKVNERLRSRMLHPDETEELKNMLLIRLWTLKESALKCLGTGLRTNMSDILITPAGENTFTAKINNDNCFEICSFLELDHYIALTY